MPPTPTEPVRTPAKAAPRPMTPPPRRSATPTTAPTVKAPPPPSPDDPPRSTTTVTDVAAGHRATVMDRMIHQQRQDRDRVTRQRTPGRPSPPPAPPRPPSLPRDPVTGRTAWEQEVLDNAGKDTDELLQASTPTPPVGLPFAPPTSNEQLRQNLRDRSPARARDPAEVEELLEWGTPDGRHAKNILREITGLQPLAFAVNLDACNCIHVEEALQLVNYWLVHTTTWADHTPRGQASAFMSQDHRSIRNIKSILMDTNCMQTFSESDADDRD